MRRTCLLVCLAFMGLLLPRPGSAAYDLSWQTVDGGGQSDGSTYTLTGAVGQSDAGAMSDGNYTLHGGFWIMTAHINVKQGTTTLSDGAGSYDFGSVTPGSSSAAITFTIENTGLALLGVSNIQPGGDFSVTQAASATVAPQSSTTFTATFTPTTTGTRTATISITNSDNASARNPYTFTVIGIGVASSGNSYLLWTK